MNTSVSNRSLDKKRQRIDVLIENKVSFAGEHAELSIYDTYLDAQKVALHSTELLFCGMISGKKIMQCDILFKAFKNHVFVSFLTVRIAFSISSFIQRSL